MKMVCLGPPHLPIFPKQHKSQRLDEIIAHNPSEYMKMRYTLDIDGYPIVAGSAQHSPGISATIHEIM